MDKKIKQNIDLKHRKKNLEILKQERVERLLDTNVAKIKEPLKHLILSISSLDNDLQDIGNKDEVLKAVIQECYVRISSLDNSISQDDLEHVISILKSSL